MKAVLPIFLVFLLSWTCAWGQSAESPLMGHVLSRDSLQPVPGAHVMNLSTHEGVSATETGFFRLPVHLNDTVVVSAVGFYSDTLTVSARPDALVDILLLPRTYELETFVFERGDLKAFKEKFLALDLPEEPKVNMTGVDRYEGPIKPVKPTILNPVSLIYSKFDKRAKQERKVRVLERQQNFERLLATKFNEELVQDVTGLEGDSLKDFMNYCRLEAEFVASATEYDLRLAISDCYQSFQATRN
ncbi:CarboxypepD_reg-like domain-containing protein [Catalinimonas alkaloidigena]|uniref:CarboxypepD_reg-like domain-containing protein n=1 Tax=Catalinimonas alkaloidigena TaxID=1075417 RepID=A0A1G9KBC4_9BACT|nr:carboxypeptidase-like regulatory domain-containing protein [Catalinimonas alkaloidigena]SDL46932.1 CarboxypepD_reg-like domain-containing protein [Catalinimonas alkaloidigena]